MKKLYVFILLFIITTLFSPILEAAVIPLDKDLTQKNISRDVQYFEDTEQNADIKSITGDGIEWTDIGKKSVNFGFAKTPFWFKFSVNNRTDRGLAWYLEITYPMLDIIDLYIPDGDGGFKVKKSGDHLPFNSRDIKDKNFIFSIKQGPGESTYYLYCKSTSSINFSLIMWEPETYINNIFNSLPVMWTYFGLALALTIYNLFLFFSIKDIICLYYIGFTIFGAFLQMTLSGQSFQYFWPNSIWWANNCLPFFQSVIILIGGFFFRDFMQTRKNYPIIDKIIIISAIIPGAVLTVLSLLLDYRLSITVGIILSMLTTLLFSVLSFILVLRNSRPARFYFFSLIFFYIGAVIYFLKSAGVLEPNFFTTWSIQLGGALAMLLLSFGIIDKINTMRIDLVKVNIENEKNAAEAKSRAEYLQTIFDTVQTISREMLSASKELTEITENFSKLSSEQAATSEEMSATFEELSASNENILKAMTNQQTEGIKTKELSINLKKDQKDISSAGLSVLEHIKVISETTGTTELTLDNMLEKMRIINEGGKSITQFIDVINDITDRINLLSLNASIEAARAGDHGRGFAVVADEIGKLAQATSDNSREIGGKISSIIQDIEEGFNIVNTTKSAIDVTFNRVNSITERISQVSDLMTRQGSGIQEIVKQAALVDELAREITKASTEQNLSVEQTQTTVERLAEMAQDISSSNQKIVEFIVSIRKKAQALDALVKEEE